MAAKADQAVAPRQPGGPAGQGRPTGQGRPAGEVETRGHTTIADRVLETLAARAALDVPGVRRYSQGPDVLSPFTGTLPSATAESAGDRVRLRLQIAVAWDSEVRDVAAQVRRSVRERLTRSTGKVIDRVDVTVAALVTGAAPGSPESRRVQ